jgi:type I restriction enzyme S subunit
MKQAKYSDYKDSGIDWIGKIPSHWEARRLGTGFEERREKVSDKDFPPLSVTKNGIVPRLDSAAKTNDGDNRKLVKEGDFVINSRSDRKGSSGIAKQDGSVSLINIVMKPTKMQPSYCNFLLKGYSFIEEFYKMGHGIVADLWTTRYNEMKNIKIPIPPLPEQKAIADYLDRKCGQIDQAVVQKKQLIGLLKERKQIMIQQAVTKGLNPKALMKDSGIDWIGEIPEGWEVAQSKRLFRQRKERAKKQDIQLTASQKYGIIPQEEFMELEGRRVTQVEFNRDILKHIKANDFVISMRSFQGGLELSEYSGCVSSAYVALIPIKHIVSSFFKYLFKCDGYIKALSSTSNLVRDGQALRFDNFSAVSLLIIPENEQEAIAEFLDLKCAQIDNALGLQEKQIAKLKEYKQVLINSAVTGKIKVEGV